MYKIFWAQRMPETCRVLWQNKFWIFDASSSLFYTKPVTMLGHLNIKYYICIRTHALLGVILKSGTFYKIGNMRRQCYKVYKTEHFLINMVKWVYSEAWIPSALLPLWMRLAFRLLQITSAWYPGNLIVSCRWSCFQTLRELLLLFASKLSNLSL
jgi:hypothetical protein